MKACGYGESLFVSTSSPLISGCVDGHLSPIYGGHLLKVVDRFTTRDGSWEPNNLPFSITPIAAEKYKGIPGAGAAHHIFVKVPVEAGIVEFNTLDRKNKNEVFVPGIRERWATFPIFQAYDPVTSEGAWHVWIDGERVTEEGIGLPYGWHVSTFLVVEDVEVKVPDLPTDKDRWTLYRNGVLVFDSEG
jgi:hypothetical protein